MSPIVLIRLGRSFSLRTETRSPEIMFPLNELELVRGAIRQTCATGPSGAQFVIEVERPLLQVRSLTGIPRTGRDALKRLVAAQAGRFFRATSEALVTDACWIRTPRDAQATVLAVAVPAQIVHEVCQTLQSAGGNLIAVRARDDRVAGHRLSLMPPAVTERLKAASLKHRKRILGVGLSAVLVVGLGLLSILHAVQVRSEREVTSLQSAIDSALGVRSAVTDLEYAMRTLSPQSSDVLLSLELLATLAKGMDTRAYLTRVEVVDTGEVRLEGMAENPAALLRSLREIPDFEQVAFASPPMQRSTLLTRSFTRFELRVVLRSTR
jgi:hypothetical protein